MCVCFQHVGPVVESMGDYDVATESHIQNSELCVDILLHRWYTFKPVPLLQAPLQAVAVNTSPPFGPSLIVCSAYNQPCFDYDLDFLANYQSRFWFWVIFILTPHCGVVCLVILLDARLKTHPLIVGLLS